jgi:hypothetical protein
MSNGTPLFIVTRDAEGLFTLPDGQRVKTHDLPVGAMWRCDCHGEQGWLIALPGGRTFGEHHFANRWCTLAEVPVAGRWNVSGEPPNLTVTPSIHIMGEGGWHGFITNGEIVS